MSRLQLQQRTPKPSRRTGGPACLTIANTTPVPISVRALNQEEPRHVDVRRRDEAVLVARQECRQQVRVGENHGAAESDRDRRSSGARRRWVSAITTAATTNNP